MKRRERAQEPNQQVVFVPALDLLKLGPQVGEPLFGSHNALHKDNTHHVTNNLHAKNNILLLHERDSPAIGELHFPFTLKPDQTDAVKAWLANQCKGSVIYGSGTGKTEIAFECARRLAELRTKDDKSRKRFAILFLVPRIVLVEQNYNRLIKYHIPRENVGKFFGEEKQLNEITIATYHSALANLAVLKYADMIIFDEVHLVRGAFSRIFDAIRKSPDIALLGLTATIDEQDSRNATILSFLPPVRRYLIRDAVIDKRLAKPIVIPIEVKLTVSEQRIYDKYSTTIRNISRRFNRYDAREMMVLMKTAQGFPRWQARAWFLNVKKRKQLLASCDNKLQAAADIIAEKCAGQKIMVFSETLESVRKLKALLKGMEVESALIDSRTPSFRRQRILSGWGNRFYALLSVHTLEIGYDIPEARIEIILATTSNMNQVVQRIGRVLRKVEGKDSAFVYLIYVSDTRDDKILSTVRKAIESAGGGSEKD